MENSTGRRRVFVCGRHVPVVGAHAHHAKWVFRKRLDADEFQKLHVLCALGGSVSRKPICEGGLGNEQTVCKFNANFGIGNAIGQPRAI